MSLPRIDVLVPTCGRPAALAVTLTSISAQDYPDLRVVVSDQTEGASALGRPEVVAVLRYLQARGRPVETWHHLPRRGMAEQRAFLLAQAQGECCLFVDDDVILEPDLLTRLQRLLAQHRCGFVGSALHGLSYLGQQRPEQEQISFWEGMVEPETVVPGSGAWPRHHLHSAANLFHLQQRLGAPREASRAYRVAWVGGCVLFDTAKLRAAGGFEFWRALPAEHCGEDVLAQLRVMARFGGCGILPSGAYHMELPTTLQARDVDAPWALPVQGSPPAGPGSEQAGP
ncbi:glycosyltransferase family 2 protein [Massilia consociata]|uniref:Glycosyltransferase family 2 protein n=1 Tax=Massilia consociata TaxID=760117 RepID=A0ABV6FIZ4_9BURK